VELVDDRVTGHPVQTYYASRHMQQSYLYAGLYALAAVLVLLWIDLRSLAHSLLAMVPLGLGCVQLCGLLGWLDIPLNPANMIVLPLLLGIGVDDGVHLVHHWRRQGGRFRLSDSLTVALLLNSTTTMAGFGSLILARHQGLASLGQVLTLGVMTCLASSILFFPALLAWISRHRPEDDSAEEMVEEDQSEPVVLRMTPPDASAPVETTAAETDSEEDSLQPAILAFDAPPATSPRRRALPRRVGEHPSAEPPAEREPRPLDNLAHRRQSGG
jgi:predicted RND superfamily exporter protein